MVIIEIIQQIYIRYSIGRGITRKIYIDVYPLLTHTPRIGQVSRSFAYPGTFFWAWNFSFIISNAEGRQYNGNSIVSAYTTSPSHIHRSIL